MERPVRLLIRVSVAFTRPPSPFAQFPARAGVDATTVVRISSWGDLPTAWEGLFKASKLTLGGAHIRNTNELPGLRNRRPPLS
jgi:hypothetical protein